MNRLLISAAAFATVLGSAGLAGAQSDPAMSYRVVRITPYSLADMRRQEIPASPSCGAANPQGGVPTSVTWGQCP
jgi:hypothetical protein